MDEPKEKSFAEQVDDALNEKGNLEKQDRFNHLKVCDTLQILLDIGCRQLPMMYSRRHLRNAIRPKDAHLHTHSLTVEQIKMMPKLLQNPVMVFDSVSPQSPNSIGVILNAVDNDNAPIMVTISPNGKRLYELKTVDSNFITSVYGKDCSTKYIERIVADDKLLYCSKEKSQELFERWGLQLPELTNDLDFNCIIHQSRNIIKPFEEKAKNTHNVKSKGKFPK